MALRPQCQVEVQLRGLKYLRDQNAALNKQTKYRGCSPRFGRKIVVSSLMCTPQDFPEGGGILNTRADYAML